MKKKILTLLYVLILHSNAHSASEPQLPPPLPSSEEIINSENKGNSFWNKTLNFFGLGNKKQENKKVLAQEKQAEKTANDLGYKNNICLIKRCFICLTKSCGCLIEQISNSLTFL